MSTHLIKITPNSYLIPENIELIDQLFLINNLTDNKYLSCLQNINNKNQISILDSDFNKINRFIDDDFDINNNIGKIWFTSSVENNKSFYIKISDNNIDDNNSNVFSVLNHICSHGLFENSGNSIDRLSYRDIYSASADRNIECIIDKGFGVNIVGNKYLSYVTPETSISNSPSLLSESNSMSVHMLFKRTLLIENAIRTLFAWSTLGAFTFNNDPNIYISLNIDEYDLYFDATSVMSNDEYCLLSIVFDGSKTDLDQETQDKLRLKAYVNGVNVPMTFELWGTEHVDSIIRDLTGYSFTYGGNNSSFPGVFDEILLSKEVPTDNSINVRATQWLTNSDYWLCSISPYIENIIYQSKNLFIINGSGFKPENINSIVNLNNNTIDILSISDNQIIIYNYSNIKTNLLTFTITNSDNNSVSKSIYICNLKTFENISSLIDNNIDVCFVNDDLENININKIHLDQSGYVNIVGKDYSISSSKSIYLTGGKIHNITGIHSILYKGTDKNIGIKLIK